MIQPEDIKVTVNDLGQGHLEVKTTVCITVQHQVPEGYLKDRKMDRLKALVDKGVEELLCRIYGDIRQSDRRLNDDLRSTDPNVLAEAIKQVEFPKLNKFDCEFFNKVKAQVEIKNGPCSHDVTYYKREIAKHMAYPGLRCSKTEAQASAMMEKHDKNVKILRARIEKSLGYPKHLTHPDDITT